MRSFSTVCRLLLLLGILSILIKMDSAGPVFFEQERVGKNGQKFNIFKLRSMRVDAPKYAISPDEAQDSRITRIGRLLRRTSLDELPQLLNVRLRQRHACAS